MTTYAEELTLGRWRPVTYPQDPDTKGGRIVRSCGALGPQIRGVTEIAPEHEGKSLRELTDIYGDLQ